MYIKCKNVVYSSTYVHINHMEMKEQHIFSEVKGQLMLAVSH